MIKSQFKENLIKYISAISISSIGSEAFKLASSLYIYRFTGDFWLVTIMYLLLQLPTLFVYGFAHKLSSLLKDKKALLLADIISAIFLLIPIGMYFAYAPNLQVPIFSYILVAINTIIGFIHSYRFIHLKNVTYYIANNSNEMKNYNIGFSLSIGIGLFLSPILSLFLFNYLEFYILVFFNIATFIISGFLYFSLKTKEMPYEFKQDVTKKTETKPAISSWMYVIFVSIFIGIFLYPKNSGLIPFFEYSKFDYKSWTFYLTIIMSGIGLLASIIIITLNNAKKTKNWLNKVENHWLILAMVLLNLTWVIIDLFVNKTQTVIYYIVVNTIQQMLFSLMLPSYYSETYHLFSKKYYQKQNGLSMIARIIVPSIITLLITLVLKLQNYYYAYLVYSIFIIILAIIIILSHIFIKRYNVSKYYDSAQATKSYATTSKKGLWVSEAKVLKKQFPDKEKEIKILDLGCGMGRTTFALQKLYPNAEIDAIDINKNYIKFLQKNNTFTNINFLEFDISKKLNKCQEIRDKKYDLILFSFNGLSNIIKAKDVKRTIKNIEFLLKKQGKFIFTLHNMFSSEQYTKFWKEEIKVDEIDLLSNKKVLIKQEYGEEIKNRFYSQQNVKTLLENYNLTLNESFIRNDELEPDWVKEISYNCIFYVAQKK
ncbi:methyltransferase domain-containing protein [Mycoplasma phocimorsus]|uniref:methyltransferase domain-containing protein n=1 Tax=Mycoplasma phocimorsus TaxID=3045839 RepID=UPI0024C03F61|nr:methyltransferase domain-containing protein [Mycoplasma phocimorsus]MDJ1646104.1 methyltransferase domain-containing protein [Mycoplasma phocimorsus]MDJ1647688.1 methyltransferase domain-containing protein [Mycoplasma phocimorsus]